MHKETLPSTGGGGGGAVITDANATNNQTKLSPLPPPAIKRSPMKEAATLNSARRKGSLPITPEEDQHDINKAPTDTRISNLHDDNAPHILNVLIVFSSEKDATAVAIHTASAKLGFDTTTCTDDTALEAFQSKHHDLIFIDTRSSKLDYETLCRSIRNTKGSQHTVLIAIIKRSNFEKDDAGVASLIVDSGFSRCIGDGTHVTHWINELLMFKHSDCKQAVQISTSQNLYAALDRIKDGVIIADDNCHLQYLNHAAEKFFGYRTEEIAPRPLHEYFFGDAIQSNALISTLTRNRTWHGPITMRRKNHDQIALMCRGVPITAVGRNPTHFVLVLELHHVDPNVSYASGGRGSIFSMRRSSEARRGSEVKSIGSDYLRRTSMAKLQTLPLEAPITKILTFIAQAQEMAGSNSQLVLMLDKAVDTLRCTELYNPNIKEEVKARSEEPVASDLIGALLSQNPISQLYPSSTTSRRGSINSTLAQLASLKGGISKKQGSSVVKDLLDTSLQWDFDIFKLEELTNKRPLAHLGMNLFGLFDVAAVLEIDEKILHNWLVVIEANYHAENHYHNSTHAADVMQAIAGFLDQERMKQIMDPLDEATALIAAGAHDVDHPGKSSAFLSNSDNPLAICYNDITVLEMHHSALMFKLTLGNDKVNIFKNLEREVYKTARQNVVDMILATEMTKHFEHLTKFVNVFCTKPVGGPELETVDSEYLILTGESKRENLTLVKRIMIKCADVSNPTRPLAICVEWAQRIAEEYFEQTDEEMSRGLPVMMPMFDRRTCSIPKAQIGFVDFIINDMIEAWNVFIDMPQLISYMKGNYLKWKEYDEEGYTTTADIKSLQMRSLSIIAQPSASIE